MYSDWTTKFFGGLAVEFWASVAPPPSEAEIGLLRSLFSEGGELLDVACGAGRFTIPMAAAGYSMTGVDLSTDFLDLARQRDATIDWQERDIRDLQWSRRFDGAICFGNSFAYFPREESRAFLQGVAKALKKGARFVLESGATAESLLPNLQRERRIEAGGLVFSSVNRYDAKESRLDIEYSFSRGEQREVKSATTWVFTSGEVISMLSEAGFELQGLYGSAAKEEFTLGSPRAIFVARLQ